MFCLRFIWLFFVYLTFYSLFFVFVEYIKANGWAVLNKMNIFTGRYHNKTLFRWKQWGHFTIFVSFLLFFLFTSLFTYLLNGSKWKRNNSNNFFMNIFFESEVKQRRDGILFNLLPLCLNGYFRERGRKKKRKMNKQR